MKTQRQVRMEFQAAGDTLSDWAKRHGYKRRTVYAVLNGQVKGTRGIGHQIAVGLGMKRSGPSIP